MSESPCRRRSDLLPVLSVPGYLIDLEDHYLTALGTNAQYAAIRSQRRVRRRLARVAHFRGRFASP